MGDGESADLIGRTLGKKFLVRGCLGSGGMGAVYEVEHVLTKRVGALKLLHPSVSENGRILERFVREASAAGRIGNPHIVETIDAGELASGEPYIFMELLSGTAVSDLIKRRGRLRFEEAREIALQAAEGLAAAHAAGVVHRDVKPENLFLCRGEPAYVKLLDFGISKFSVATDHRLTAEGVPMGTPYYMSPEQVAGKSDIGPASDVYSLGVVLYECVTGRVPFDAETLPALSIKIFEGNYAPPSSLNARVASGLDEVIARAMATAPSKRYASMSELREALLALNPGAPVSLAQTLASDATNASNAPSMPRPTELEATAELAPSSSAQPLDSLAPPTMASAPVRSHRKVGLAAGLVGIAAVAAVVFARAPAAPLVTDGVASVTPSATESSPPSTVPEATPIKPRESAVASASAAPPSTRKPAVGPAATAVQSGRPASKAARDGLTEQNPFD